MAKATVTHREEAVIPPTKSVEQELREEALEARNMVEIGYMKLARCLYDIYYRDAFRTWDYSTFEDYVDSELQINYRKAMYLIEIYNKATMLNMDLARLENIGWTKARELVRIVDQSNTDEWLSIAEESTAKELSFKVKIEKDKLDDRASVSDAVPSTTTITLRLGMAENAIIQEAVEQSASLINTDDLALALANICQEWVELKGISPAHTSLEDHMDLLEEIYGQRLMIVGTVGRVHEEEEDEGEEADSEELEDFLK